MPLQDLILRTGFMEKWKEGKAGAKKKQKTATDAADPTRILEQDPKQQRARVAPRVQVVNGRIVLDTQSLKVQAQENELADYKRVEEEDDQIVNSHTYNNWTMPRRWSEADTELLYEGLRQFGTDFSLIGHMFPGRKRKQLKVKFHVEWRRNPERIEEILAGQDRSNGGHQMYKDMLEKLRLSRPAGEIVDNPDANGEAPPHQPVNQEGQPTNQTLQVADLTASEQVEDATDSRKKTGDVLEVGMSADDLDPHDNALAGDDRHVDEEKYYY